MSITVSSPMHERWNRILGRLRSEFGDTAFKSWLKVITLETFENNILTMSVPTEFLETWVKDQYLDHINTLWEKEEIGVTNVVLVCKPITHSNDENDTPVGSDTQEGAKTDPRFTFNSFAVNQTNQLAFQAAKKVSEGTAIFNPLYICGGVGLGKTHLLQAITSNMQKTSPNKKVLYLSAEKFMYLFINAIRNQDMIMFKDELRSLDVLLVDDIQFISGKKSTQEEFFHTFNDLIDRGCQIILSGNVAPAFLESFDARIISRMNWGIVAEVQKTDYDLRCHILQTKSQSMGYSMSREIIKFLASKITSNVRELEGALNRLMAYSLLMEVSVDITMVPQILHDVLSSSNKQITVEDIQKRVANYFNIKFSDMHSPRRSRDVARPRQMAIYLAKQLTQISLPEIGRKFGGRDHTTIMYAVSRIEKLIASDSSLSNDLATLKRSFN